jgi:transposase-like protein
MNDVVNGTNGTGESPSAGHIPDPEVDARAKRRRFTAAYKVKVLRLADACKSQGEIGALLRREGLYSSHLATWRKLREKGALSMLSRRRGRPANNPLVGENERLRRETVRLAKRLEQAETIIEVQKKLCSILGLEPASPGLDGRNS